MAFNPITPPHSTLTYTPFIQNKVKGSMTLVGFYKLKKENYSPNNELELVQTSFDFEKATRPRAMLVII